jgi:phenylacetate-CoA ligase
MSSAQDFIHRYYDHLMESQYWPRERIVAEQREYLEQLIRHARKHVPFYATRLDMLFTPRGEIDWDRWSDLPILTREDVVEKNEALLSTNLPKNHGPTKASTTSGSTGTPLRVVTSYLANMLLQAATHRAHAWFRLDPSRDMMAWFGDEAGVASLPDGARGRPWAPPWDERSTGRQVQLNRNNTPDQVLDFIERGGFGYVVARPDAAASLAQEALRQRRTIQLDAILAYSTEARPDEREECMRAFGAPILVPYSAKEGQFMAHQCPSGTHLHINDELVLVEIVDEDGKPCAQGATGRVVVTPIYNFAQPLIRYEQGDLAVAGAACACGRTLGVIERITGRTVHMFKMPDGRRISMGLSTQSLLDDFGARYWQMAQIEPLLIEVRYVPSRAAPGDEAPVIEAIRARTHPDMQVKFSRREDLHRPDGRKFIADLYEVPEHMQ